MLHLSPTARNCLFPFYLFNYFWVLAWGMGTTWSWGTISVVQGKLREGPSIRPMKPNLTFTFFCCCSAWNPNPSGHHRGVSMKTEQSKRNGIKRHESYSVSCNKCMSHGRIHTLDDKYDDFNLLQITGWFSYSFQKIRR